MVEMIIYEQVDGFMENKFLPDLWRFRQNHNEQNSLLKMIEN